MHAHFDCFSGAAGDMLLAACLDAAEEEPAVLLEHLASQLKRAVPAMADEFSVSCRRVWKGSGRIAAWNVNVESVYHHAPAMVPGGSASSLQDTHDGRRQDMGDQPQHEHSHTHHSTISSQDHTHEHEHQQDGPQEAHEHAHSHSSAAHQNHSHAHHHDQTSSPNTPPIRNLPEIRRLLSETPEAIEYIPASVRTLAVAAFTELAHAEAHVHGAPSIDDVHFHEVGAIDSIVDIVLTCWTLHHILEGVVVDSVSCSPIPLGRGRVRTAHGILPVPAPATLFLLRDVVQVTEGPPTATGELVTPTAAALLRAMLLQQSRKSSSTSSGLPSASRLRRIGVGAGTKEFTGHPNIVRLLLLEPPALS